jgi:hypothetical protein
MTGGSNKRVLLAALLCAKPGCRTRLTYRVHADHGHGKDRRQGFTDAFHASAGLDLAPSPSCLYGRVPLGGNARRITFPLP